MQKYRSIMDPWRQLAGQSGCDPSKVGPGDAGFTLMELMISLLILAIGILGIWSMQSTAIRGNAQAKWITQGSALAADQVEKLMRMDYDDADVSAGTHTRVEDPYTVHWVVSNPDTTINNVKTITVTASWTVTGQTRSVSYVYYKANQL